MRHTDFRGPWIATGWENTIVNTADGNTIACCPTPRAYAPIEEVKAFARLIASAPDMLAMLQELSTWLICPDCSAATVEHIKERIDAVIDAATEPAA